MSDEMPPYRLEAARSGRSRCKSCRRKIAKDSVRFGVLIEGPFGPGYLWHHLRCAAKRRIEEVEEAYALGLQGELKVPTLESLRKAAAEAEKPKAEARDAPWAELAPTARSKCKQCGGGIEKGAARVVLLQRVEFGSQLRATPVKVHPECVSGFVAGGESILEAEGLIESLRHHSRDLEPKRLEEVVAAIGDLA